MKKNRYMIAGVFIIVVVIIFGALTVKTIIDIQSETTVVNAVVGEWIDNNNNTVMMSFSDSGQAVIANSQMGTFSIDPKKQQITINYDELSGNKTQTYRYSIDGSSLTMTDNGTGESVTYTKK